MRAAQRQQRVQLRLLSEEFIERRRGVQPAREHLARRRVAVDQRTGDREGDDAVGHVQKQRGELVALVLGLGDRVLEDLCHVVEVPREHADLVVALDGHTLRKVACGDLPRADGERLNGRDEDARKQEREHHADHQAKAQRTQDNAHQFARQRIDRRAVVVDVRDVRMLVCHDGHSQIHEFTRDRSVLPDFAVHRRQQILRHAHLCPLIRTLEHLPEAV